MAGGGEEVGLRGEGKRVRVRYEGEGHSSRVGKRRVFGRGELESYEWASERVADELTAIQSEEVARKVCCAQPKWTKGAGM